MKAVRVLSLLLLVSGCSLMPERPQPSIGKPSPTLTASATVRYAPQLLRKDTLYALRQIALIHPEPYARVDKSAFDAGVNQLLTELTRPMTQAEFYLRLAPLLNSLSDSHTYLHMPNIEAARFPLALSLEQNDRLYQVSDLRGLMQIPTGAQIIGIDNAPIEYLLSRMLALANAETAAGRRRWVQLNFARLLTLLGHIGPQFKVDYLWRGQRLSLTLDGLPAVASGQDNPMFSMYGYSQLSERTALLWLNDFYEKPALFADFLRNKFSEMEAAGVDRLVIDLRFNPGGYVANMQRLISYLTTSEIVWQKDSAMRASEPLRQQYYSAARAARKEKAWRGLRWLPLEWTDRLQQQLFWSDTGKLVKMESPPIVPSPEHNFARRGGKVWIINNGYCYSACAMTLAIANAFNLGKTLGEPAGSRAGLQFVYPVELELPHTGLKVSIATTRIRFNSEQSELHQPRQLVTRPTRHIEGRFDTVLAEAIHQAELD